MHQHSVNPNNGYCSATKTYQSLHDNFPLPPATTPLSITEYVLSLLHSNPNFSPSSPVFIDSSTHNSLSYAEFLCRIDSLTSSLSHLSSSSDTALILSPTSFHVPVLYFSLLSLGVVTSSANPISTQSELLHYIQLIKPTVIFAVSSAASKLTSCTHNVPVILIDSPQFDSMLASGGVKPPRASVVQSSTGLILFSSGTTGRVKGVELSHRYFITLIAVYHHRRMKNVQIEGEKCPAVTLFFLPLFHVFGFFMMLRAISMAETLVLMERFDFVKFLETVERYRVTYMPVSPPLLVALEKSELTEKYDLSSLESLGCGGAPLSKEVAKRFRARFPNVELTQGYGLTEAAGVARTVGSEESERYGSVGRLQEHVQAKIVDPATGDALPPGQQGELWLSGPTIMKGYVGDKEATAVALHPDGWLKTGDLCYFDSNGYLYIVDRLKELIKYKGYQVPPAELESVLLSHPDIADAAVIPYPDEEAGQIPMAFVVRRSESSITASQVMDYVAKEGYALTEGIGVASTAKPEESERYGSVGHLQEHMQAKIVDPSSGDALPPGQQGELWLRGPTIMKGYVGDKEGTAAVLHPGGWLKTGDLCYFDAEGYLYIVGRLKELIKYKAYQVPPAELENLLLSHPEIADVAVIPYPDEEAGEIPMAFVVRRPESSITASQVMDYAAREVSPYKRIRRIAFVDAIPKNPSGKILRRELVKQATASLSKL